MLGRFLAGAVLALPAVVSCGGLALAAAGGPADHLAVVASDPVPVPASTSPPLSSAAPEAEQSRPKQQIRPRQWGWDNDARPSNGKDGSKTGGRGGGKNGGGSGPDGGDAASPGTKGGGSAPGGRNGDVGPGSGAKGAKKIGNWKNWG